MDMDQAIQKMGKGLQSQDPNNISGNKSMIMLSNKEENLPPQDLSSVGKPLRDKVVHAYNRTLKMFIGSVHVDLKTIHVQPDDSSANPAQGSQTLSKAQYKYHTVSTILYPARWLVNQGFSYSPRINVVGYFLWELKIKVTYAVPDDSLVFEFCKVGDVSGLKRLFANKQASTKDVDSLGRTPIYVSLSARCKMLVERFALEQQSLFKKHTLIVSLSLRRKTIKSKPADF